MCVSVYGCECVFVSVCMCMSIIYVRVFVQVSGPLCVGRGIDWQWEGGTIGKFDGSSNECIGTLANCCVKSLDSWLAV